MKVYLAIKFKEDYSNKERIEAISRVLQTIGIETLCIAAQEYDSNGRALSSPQALMAETFVMIDSSDAVIVEFSEKGIGLGIEAGYAHAKRKPVVVIARTSSDISSTLEGIARRIIFYDSVDELPEKLAFLRQ